MFLGMQIDIQKKILDHRRRVLFVDDRLSVHEDFKELLIGESVADFDFFQAYSIRESIDLVGKSLSDGGVFCLICLYVPAVVTEDWLGEIHALSDVALGADILLLRREGSAPKEDIDFGENLSQSLVMVYDVSHGAGLRRVVGVLLDSWRSRRVELHEEKNLAYQDALCEIESLRDQLSHARIFAERESLFKGQILTNVSHEFRTPMHALLGYLEVLESELPADVLASEKCREAIFRMNLNGEKLLDVVGRLLHVAELDCGELELREAGFSVVGMMTAELEHFAGLLENKGVGFKVDIDECVPAMVLGDEIRVGQVIRELLDNAVKFTCSGSVEIHVGYDAVEGLAVCVKDTGIGICDEKIEEIFQPFYQADGSLTRLHGGIGLGLSHCRMNVKLMGGEIGVESEEGVGATFKVVLPLREYEAIDNSVDNVEVLGGDDAMVEREVGVDLSLPRKSDPVFEGCGYRVLLVEDGEDNQKLISMILRKAGVTVDIAENGDVGVNLVERSVAEGDLYQLILMDMQMPVMDGYAATRYLRGKGYGLPIVAITAHALDGDREKCLDAGCTDYATKPVRKSDLLDIIHQYAG